MSDAPVQATAPRQSCRLPDISWRNANAAGSQGRNRPSAHL